MPLTDIVLLGGLLGTFLGIPVAIALYVLIAALLD